MHNSGMDLAQLILTNSNDGDSDNHWYINIRICLIVLISLNRFLMIIVEVFDYVKRMLFSRDMRLVWNEIGILCSIYVSIMFSSRNIMQYHDKLTYNDQCFYLTSTPTYQHTTTPTYRIATHLKTKSAHLKIYREYN